MKLSLWTIILPRLEVFFLEEWIEHNLNLGFDKIYIYDNGVQKVKELHFEYRDGKEMVGHDNNIRKLAKNEQGVKWDKKPDADYNLELTDKQIYEKLNSVIDKFKNKVELINWRYGQEIDYPYPLSQTLGYAHCVENKNSDWWVTLDPDEYLILRNHNNIKDFISSYYNKYKIPKLCINQRIFNERVKGKSVKKIFEWGYDLELTKTFVKSPLRMESSFFSRKNLQTPEYYRINKTTCYNDIHETNSWLGMQSQNPYLFRKYKRFNNYYYISNHKNNLGYHDLIPNWKSMSMKIDKDVAQIYHYRGDSSKMGGAVYKNFYNYESWKSEEDFHLSNDFNKVDKSMEKYIN